MTPHTLTSDQINQTIAALHAADAMIPCLVCGSPKITIASQVASIPVGTPGVFLNSNYLPCVLVTCKKCGFVRSHSLEVLGMGAVGARKQASVPPPAPEEDEDEDDE